MQGGEDKNNSKTGEEKKNKEEENWKKEGEKNKDREEEKDDNFLNIWKIYKVSLI